ncbi:MAG: glycosyl hydrolase [Campylobacterales bacterium]|nr:glycosyl hydrolase [Campylobacterales bacterium]
MKLPFKWDEYSDQPALLQDKLYKKTMRKKELFSLVMTYLTALFILPLSLLATPFVKRREISSKEFFSLGVDFQRNPKETQELLDELDVSSILLRYKLWESQTLPELLAFAQQNSQKKIILKVMQDREHIEDRNLLQNELRTLFKAMAPYVDIFEIGTTINRSKWGFFSVNEYNNFFAIAYDLKNSEFPGIHLIGSGVIDFEFHYTSHTLFHLKKYKFNGVSSLLYVDRRGAPENTQLGFALSDKIALLSTMAWLSPKTEQRVFITETNWPLKGTAPYAPTSEYECVSEEEYANYMLRYYLLAFASQQIDSVSWHQLIAPGYGLVDNRDGIHKRPAFQTYQYMLSTMKNAQFLRLDIKRGYYILQCLIDEQLLQIHWSLQTTTLKNEDFFEVYSRNGELIEDEKLNIGASPLYIYITHAVGQKVNCL